MSDAKSTRAEIAEDFRRVGVALIVTGLVGAAIRPEAALLAASVVAVVGIALCASGYVFSAIDRRL